MPAFRRFIFCIPLLYGLAGPFLAFDSFLAVFAPHSIAPDAVTLNDQRFAPVRTFYPDIPLFQYVDLHVPPDPLHYYLAQYALAPSILIRNDKEEWVLTDQPPANPAPVSPPPGMVALVHFPSGISIFQRGKK